MAQETDSVKLGHIRQEMQETKARFAGSLSDLKLSFSHRRGVVNERVKEETTKVLEQTSRTARILVDDLDRTGRELGQTVVETVKENTIPLSVAGLGIGWLVVNSIRGSAKRGQEVGGLQFRPEDAVAEQAMYGYYAQGAEAAQEMIEGRVEPVIEARGPREVSSRARKSNRLVEDHPLFVGLGAVAVGALVGLFIPRTRREDEWMGEKKEEIVERSKEVGRTAVHETKEAFQQASERVREEWKKGISEAVHAAGEEFTEAVERSADATTEEIRRQAGTLEEESRKG